MFQSFSVSMFQCFNVLETRGILETHRRLEMHGFLETHRRASLPGSFIFLFPDAVVDMVPETIVMIDIEIFKGGCFMAWPAKAPILAFLFVPETENVVAITIAAIIFHTNYELWITNYEWWKQDCKSPTIYQGITNPLERMNWELTDTPVFWKQLNIYILL